MDLSEQDLDLFGEDYEDDDGHGKEGNAEASRRSSSASSSAASSSSSSASSSNSSGDSGSGSGSASGSASGGDDGGDDEDNGEVRSNHYDKDEKDLFGSDNEDYVKTPATSSSPVPALPPVVRAANDYQTNRRGQGRGRWQNDRGGAGLLPKPNGAYPQSQRYGYNIQRYNSRQDERFVSELRLSKSEETLARKGICLQEPSELACYSRVENGQVYYDDRSLRLFKRLITEEVGADLNQGFDTFIEKEDLGSKGFGDLLSAIRNKNISLQNMHFVTFRNNLNKIMATAYIRNEPWEMGVHKRNGVVFLDVHKLPENSKSEYEQRCCYYGYAFESLATEDPSRGADEEGIHHLNANVEFCSVIKTKLGPHRILMGAEMDCCDSPDDGKRFYIELKTTRELDYRNEERYEREKLLKFWIQSFLAGVPYIVIGFRNNAGVLVRTERLRIKDITQRVKMKNYWQGGVCLGFADEVLCWLYGTVKENENYILQFAPPFTRLELLQADSCPEEITNHVEQL